MNDTGIPRSSPPPPVRQSTKGQDVNGTGTPRSSRPPPPVGRKRHAAVFLRAAMFGLTGGAVGLLLLKSVNHSKARGSVAAARQLYVGSTALAFSILADSSVEHYRGGFHNRVMYVAPTVSALTLLSSARRAMNPAGRSDAEVPVFATATLAGLIGTSFHVFNTMKREGGVSWLNLFYGPPVAAPVGITFAGLFGLTARLLTSRQAPRWGRSPEQVGRVLSLGAAAGLLGTTLEAGLLHFRGAFQDPFMFLPVTVPPLAAATLATSALSAIPSARRAAGVSLSSTALLGFIGMGFHAFGIHRNMGGWRNWSQMLLQGPPVPAPPSFTGLALAGLAGLTLLQEGGEDEQ